MTKTLLAILMIPLFGYAQLQPLYKDSLQQSWVEQQFNQLTLEQKVGQLFIVAAYSNKDTTHENEILRLIENQEIGGLIFMQDNVAKQVQLTNLYQSKSKIPLLIGIDAEWGLSMRLKDTHKFPYAMTLGAIQNDSLIYEMGQKIASHCNDMGIHWNFAPVVDVNTNPNNPIIGNRSFGSDVQNVSNKGIAYADGMKSLNVLASAKHFPGHGDTSSDSHKTLPVVNHPLTRLQNVELQPFQNLINAGVTGIMIAHLDVPTLEPNNIPSTLSKSIVTDLLQNQMGFQGLIITDALNMQGVASKYPPGVVDLKAFEAGNDVLLFSQNVAKAKAEIIAKINSGEISLSRLEKSVKKILAAKYFAGLNQYSPLSTNSKIPELNDKGSAELTYKLFSKAITLVKKEGDLPFIQGERIAFIPLGSDYSTFSTNLSNYTNVHQVGAGTSLNNEKVVIGVFKSTETPYKSYKLSQNEKNIIEAAAKNNEVTLVVFSSAYSLNNLDLRNVKNVIVAYENNEYTQLIVPKMLYGEMGFYGRLPAEINANLPFGTGITIEPLSGMPRATPESQGMSSEKLNEIDQIAQKSIQNRETPGMQVLVAKNGKIIYDKNFGYYDYENYQSVTDSTLYDLASLTKVLATLPLFMKMYDSKSVRLDDKIEFYFPYAIDTDKANITFREILLHNSGLKSWIPFYKETFDSSGYPSQYYYKNVISQQFRYPVTENLFSRFIVKDMVYRDIVNSPLQSKTYDYSDLGYYILQYAVEHHYGHAENDMLEEYITKPMGIKTVTYRPLEKFKMWQIAPTEKDNYYRYQTLQGTVQDQGAALFGGVAGHAGLFGNAHDVAAIMQMYLNGGTYNGKKIIEPGTVAYFSSYQNGSRRGLGFDKQRGTKGPFFDNAPGSGFGHTGYTGTMVWADPDQQLVYVFLSNRTYPDASTNKLNRNKTRQRILKKIYEAKL